MPNLLEVDFSKECLTPDVTSIFLEKSQFDHSKYDELLNKVEFNQQVDVYLSSFEIRGGLRHRNLARNI